MEGENKRRVTECGARRRIVRVDIILYLYS